MTPDRVDYMLAHYKEFKARCAYLEPAIKSFEKELCQMKASALEEAVSIGGMDMDGMPHGTDVHSKVEEWAIRFADGYTPDHIVEATAKLSQMKEEYDQKIMTVVFVDAWLEVLSARESYIIRNKTIGNAFWRDLINGFSKEFGETYTRIGLKKIEQAALEKIYRVAQ